MGNNKKQATKGGRVTKPRVDIATGSAILTPKRKWIILEFRGEWISNQRTSSIQTLGTALRTAGWRTALFEYMLTEDSVITIEDVSRWLEKHEWITIPNGVPKGFPSIEIVNQKIRSGEMTTSRRK